MNNIIQGLRSVMPTANKQLMAQRSVSAPVTNKPRMGLATGGLPSMGDVAPWWTRQEARGDEFHSGGLFGGNEMGRADTLPVSVSADTHVIPADVVSGLGQGNTLAGARVLDAMMNTGPGGAPLPHQVRQATMPHIQARTTVPHDSRGGRQSGAVPIAASSGEYLVRPDQVLRIGGGNMKRGHDIIDKFIVKVRADTVKKMSKLPAPVGMKKGDKRK